MGWGAHLQGRWSGLLGVFALCFVDKSFTLGLKHTGRQRIFGVFQMWGRPNSVVVLVFGNYVDFRYFGFSS